MEYSKKEVIDMLKDKSCDTCCEYISPDGCHSTSRSVKNKYPETGWYYPPCPKERICEYYL